MANSNSPLLSPLEAVLSQDDTIIIDARSGPDAFARYQSGHLAGALHVDLDKDLSSKPLDAAYGGRHPLPELKDFSSLLGKLGITPSKKVIVYDDKSGANAAARFWWMLKSLGHKEIYVINGGLTAIVQEGIELSKESTLPVSASYYPVDRWKLPTMKIEEVAKAAQNEEFVIVDVREAYRYRGESEPIDLLAGHIPGAINVPFSNNLQQDGSFKPSAELLSFYKNIIGDHDQRNVVVHCGSGVTACHTLLALERAGLSGARLYVGSWSEWSRRDDYPKAIGDK